MWYIILVAKALTYQRAQLHCGLAIGDWVQVIATCATLENGWPESWEPGMTKMLGNIFEISDIDPDSGICLGETRYYFPFFVLKKLDPTL